MIVLKAKDYNELSKMAYEVIKKVVKNKSNATLGLATGSTPIGLYKEMIQDFNAGEVSYKDMTSINLDEYVALPVEHPESYRSCMNTNLFNHIDIDKSNTHVPNGLAEDVEKACKEYTDFIKNNPIDILTHPGYLVFADAEEVAKCCRDYGTLFEINSRKSHLSDDDWVKVINTGVDFVVNSDAHSPSNIGNINYANDLITRLNIPLERIKNIDGKLPTNMRFEAFKKGK